MSSRWIRYKIYNGSVLVNKDIAYSEKNIAIATKEAYDGKYTTYYLDTPCKPAGSIARTLLWEKLPGLTDQFAAQTITIDELAYYDGIEVVFVTDIYDNYTKTSGFIPKSKDVTDDRHFVLDVIQTEGNGYAVQVHHRKGILYNNKVYFNDCLKCNLDGSKADVYNFGIRPYQIYGVKGVT